MRFAVLARLRKGLFSSRETTQEMLDFCAAHNIICEIEEISMSQINEAYERMLRGDVHYRFVVDMRSLRDETTA